MGGEQGRHRRATGGRTRTVPRLAVLTFAVLLAGTTATASGAPAPDPNTPVSAADLQPEPDLAHLQADLDTARQQAADATTAAEAAVGRTVAAAIDRRAAQADVDRARDGLRGQVRSALVAGPVATMPGWVFSADADGSALLGVMRQRSVERQLDRVARLRGALARLDAATSSLNAQRSEATRQAAAAVLAADRARRLLDDGTRIAAANATVRAQLAERKRLLDAQNAALVAALARVQPPAQPATGSAQTPGQLPKAVDTNPDGSRPDASSAAQNAILALLDATPPGQLPAGYRPTGQVFQGESSWYGPGFVGSPTSTGVPYDPEKLTCAMLAVPLGTVVRVTAASGNSVTLLVNDHGPYVGDRILDVSQRANRILGLGLGQVRIEVLTRAS